MSFWQLKTVHKLKTPQLFESGGGNFDPIPDNTQCIAAIEEASGQIIKAKAILI